MPVDETLSITAQFGQAFEDSGEETPKGDTPASQSGDGDAGQGGDGNADPLSSLTIEQLLKHETLGKEIQSWGDKAAAKQISAALERERTKGKEDGIKEGRQSAEAERMDRYFSSLSQEEKAREFAADPEMAAEYARWEASKQSSKDVSAQTEIANASEVMALGIELQHWFEVLEDAQLPAEVKAELAPENFAHLGGVNALKGWSKAINAAVIKHEADKIAGKDLNEKWESFKEEQIAKSDDRRFSGLASTGKVTGVNPDLIETPTGNLFEKAFG